MLRLFKKKKKQKKNQSISEVSEQYGTVRKKLKLSHFEFHCIKVRKI